MHDKEKDMLRNRPTEKRTNNDPFMREESAQQPDANTYSSNETSASANEDLTKTASDNFREENWSEGADTRFDEVGDDDTK